MAPIMSGPLIFGSLSLKRQNHHNFGDWRDAREELIITESWGEGFMFGALLIMSLITIVNMRRGVLLHKLIFLELILAMGQGTFCFMAFRGYGWYLSSMAALTYCSWFTHNVVAWLKIRPFFTGDQASFGPVVCKWVRLVYITTLATTVPALIFQIFNNFRFFNNQSTLYERVRPYEPFMRDPWWIFSCLMLFHMIRKSYSLQIFKIVTKSPRFGILLAAIFLAFVFTIMDVLACVIPSLGFTEGINPFWKLSLVFKCLSDNIILDNFRSVLNQLSGLGIQGTAAKPQHLSEILLTKSDQVSRFESEDPRLPSSELAISNTVCAIPAEDGLPDGLNLGRKQTRPRSAVRSVGLKIQQLPHIITR